MLYSSQVPHDNISVNNNSIDSGVSIRLYRLVMSQPSLVVYVHPKLTYNDATSRQQILELNPWYELKIYSLVLAVSASQGSGSWNVTSQR